ncbi:unnamed protein product, partial [Plutella xylostella]
MALMGEPSRPRRSMLRRYMPRHRRADSIISSEGCVFRLSEVTNVWFFSRWSSCS